MIDVHCHLNFHGFEKDADQVIKEAFNAGVTTIVNVGTKIDSSEKAVEFAKQYKDLYAIVGVHPHHADKLIAGHPGLDPGSPQILKPFGLDQGGQVQDDNSDWLKQLEALAKNPKVIGIGEIGMDYYSYKSNAIVDPKLQRDVFVKQVELAAKLKLPLQIHNRLAGSDVVDILSEYKSSFQNPPGMFHCFQGDIGLLKKVLELGFYVGFDGNITYKGVPPGETTELSELVRYAPIDRILTETDSPFLSPVPLRGFRNVPKNVIIVGEHISRIKKLTYVQAEEKLNSNFLTVFKIKDL